MKSFIIKTLIAIALLIFALEYMPQANAQEEEFASEGTTATEQPELQGDLQVEGSNNTEGVIQDTLSDEEAPPPEAPYPGAKEEGFAQEDLQPSSPAPQNQTMKLEQPEKRNSDGSYTYKFDESDKSAAMSFRGGIFGAPKIQNPKNGVWFEQIYENENYPTIFLDYEWQLKTFLGEIAAKIGTGLFYAQGKGKFADSSRKYDEPPEEFTFFMFPNTASAIYRLDFVRNQWVVPYVEGGAGYFTFMEIRDDGGSPKFAGAPVTFFAGGAAFLLDWLDKKSIKELDREYGINHVYLTAEYKEFIGLDKRYDFTSRVIGAGIMMDF